MKKLILFTLLFFVISNPLSAQDKQFSVKKHEMINAIQEESYITIPYVGVWRHPDDLIFEGLVAPPFRINFQSISTVVMFTPRIVLRMLEKDSNPVRPPNYMPRLTAYYLPDYDEKEVTANYFFPSLMLSHFSNGQDSAFYKDGKINYLDGSFGTNFFELGLNWVGRPPYADYPVLGIATLSFEFHPKFMQDDPLHDIYGRYRINFHMRESVLLKSVTLLNKIKLIRKITTGKMHFKYTYIIDKPDIKVKPDERNKSGQHIWSLTLIYRHSSMDNFSVFLNLYRGQDYYNIHFDRELSLEFRLGISANTFELFN